MSTLRCDAPQATLSTSAPQSSPAAISLWRRLFLLLKSKSGRNGEAAGVRVSAVHAPKSGDEAWATAMPHISDLDAHILKDIGAPAWLIADVRQRQIAPCKRLRHIRTL